MRNISFLSFTYGISLLLSLSDFHYIRSNDNGLNVWAVPIVNEVIANNQQIILVDDNQRPSEIVDDPMKTEDTEEVENAEEEEVRGEEEEDFDGDLFDESDTCSKKIVAYYTEWRESELPPSKIPFDKLTHINYAFGRIDPDTFEVIGYSQRILSNVVAYAHQNNVKVLISVGGWSGSKHFTKMTSTEENMDAFVESVRSTVYDLELDGIDIDWEYPGREGNNNNPDYANDTPNYLILLKKLREALGKRKLITGAVSTTPFEQYGRALDDISEFAQYFNFVNVMAYDFSGSWSSVISHHESFDVPERGHRLSLKSAVQNWIDHGFPPEKLVIGVGAYGRSWIAKSKINFGLFQPFDRNIDDSEDDYNPDWLNYCQKDEIEYSSTWRYKYIYRHILSLGKINFERRKREDDFYVNALQESNEIIQYDCWLRVWDSVAQAPYLFNTKFNNIISYDDPQSLKIKMNYIQENGLAGVMMWELDGDTDDWILISTMNDSLCQ